MKKPRVVVAMSGGVDSSVAAYMMKKQGFEVIGISMKLWSYDVEAKHGCCTPEDLLDARKVADQLDIPYYVFNMQDDFKKDVIDNFVETYAKGETPNPCVRCNNDIKFDALLEKTKALGGEYLVTGHYARIIKDDSGICHLHSGLDASKDQSYFLFGLKQKQLSQSLFPLGEYKKDHIRQIAEEAKLVVFNKKDSQEICFVQDSYSDFVEQKLDKKQLIPGEIVDQDGNVLAFHSGIHQFTIGQRKGLNIPSLEAMFVFKIEENGKVYVGPKKLLQKKNVYLKNTTWIHEKCDVGSNIKLKIRSRFEAADAVIKKNCEKTGLLSCEFLDYQESVTPGQAAVIYNDQEVLGGGWITQSE